MVVYRGPLPSLQHQKAGVETAATNFDETCKRAEKSFQQEPARDDPEALPNYEVRAREVRPKDGVLFGGQHSHRTRTPDLVLTHLDPRSRARKKILALLFDGPIAWQKLAQISQLCTEQKNAPKTHRKTLQPSDHDLACNRCTRPSHLGPPRSGPGWQFDHFVGYFGINCIFCAGWSRPFVVGGDFMVFAALLETLQALTPDRLANFVAACCGAGGALPAAACAELIMRARKKREQINCKECKASIPQICSTCS